MNRIARTLVAVTVPVALGVATAAPASAWDCYNASRSGQGNVGSSTSKNWYSIPEFLAHVGLTQAQIDAAMEVIEADPRVPDDFTVFFNWQHLSEIAQKMRDDLSTDGRGIDHSDDYGTPTFDAIFEDVMSVL